MGFEHAPHDFLAFGDEDAFGQVIDLSAHVDVGREAGVVEAVDLVDLEHGQLDRWTGAPSLLRQNPIKELS